MDRAKRILKKVGRIFLWVIGGILLLFIALVLIIRTPAGQNFIVGKVTAYVSGKINTPFSIDRLFITFTGNVQLEGLYAADQSNDTLLYSRSLEVGVAFIPLINGEIKISSVDWEGLRANVKRMLPDSSFNFDYIIDAFVSNKGEKAAEDTASKPLPVIELGPLNFEDFVLNYNDEVSGMDAHLELGNFFLKSKKLDLENMDFHLRELTLENTSGYFIENKLSAESADTSESIMPHIRLDELGLTNVNFYYRSADSLFAKLDIQEFLLELPEADLNKHLVNADKIALSGSRIELFLPFTPGDTLQTDTATKTPIGLPDWDITLKSLQLENNVMVYNNGHNIPADGYFDASHVALDSFSMEMVDFTMNSDHLDADLTRLVLKERSGFRLDTAQVDIHLDKHHLKLGDLVLVTGNSRINADINTAFGSLDSLINVPGNSTVDMVVNNTILSLKDGVYFSPSIKQDSSLAALIPMPLKLEAEIKGQVNNIRVNKLLAEWGTATYFSTEGTIKGLPDMEKLRFDIPATTLKTVDTDLALFIPGDVKLPATARLDMSVIGGLDDLDTRLSLVLPEGKMDLSAHYATEDEKASFSGNMRVKDANMGQLLDNKNLGDIDVKMAFNGSGNSLKNLIINTQTSFNKLELKGYDYKKLNFTASLRNQMARVNMDYYDSNLQATLGAVASLDTLNPYYKLDLDLKGGNFYKLNVSKFDVRAKMQLEALYKGTTENFDAKINMKELVVIKEQKRYPTSYFLLTAAARKNKTEMDINSDMMKASFRSNTNPNDMVDAIMEQLNDYLRKARDRNRKKGNVTVDAGIDFYKTPLLSEVLVPGLDALDSARASFHFVESEEDLDAEIDIPHIIYKGTMVDSLYLSAMSFNKKLNYKAGFSRLINGPVDIFQTSVDGSLDRDSITAHIHMVDLFEEELVHLNASMIPLGDSAIVHIENKRLVLDGDEWSIPSGNRIFIGEKSLVFREFELRHETQKLALRTTTGKKDDLLIEFDQFHLSTFTSMLSSKQSPVNGTLQGKITLQEIFTKVGFTADVDITDMIVLQQNLGKLVVDADNLTANTYKLDMSMQGPSLDFTLKGSYFADEVKTNLKLDFNLQELKMALLQNFSDSLIRDSEGSIKGKFDVNGDVKDLKYTGNLRFDNARFNVSMLNASFALANEEIKADNNGIYFKNFDIRDGQGNRSTVNGTIGLEDITDPSLDLKLTARNFQLLNSTAKDNELFYGKVLVNADITANGTVYSPKFNLRTRFNKGTDLTFVVPESQVDVVERDGVVIFTNMKNPNDPLTNETEQESGGLTGIELSAIVEVDPATSVKIVIDERSGDNLQLSGEANLSFDMYPNGRMALSGAYEIQKGHYEMSLYNIVKRKFIIVPGSRITWSGDPLDALLSLNARYDVRASAYDLMSDQLADADPLSNNMYRQELPFEVYLKINGPLLKPQISFAIDMPENQRNALGGNVYSRLQQLNQRESELNKQVFALIVLRRFLPSDAGGGNEGPSNEAIAKSSVSQILSDQLNLLSDKYVKGLELDLNLDSYTDYQSGVGQDRTQLNVSVKKTIFNERVVVTLGSQVDLEGEKQQGQNTNEIVGDIIIEYLITKDGRYRLKGFRKNQYEGIVEGQLIVTGISIVFTRDFDTLKDLFTRPDPVVVPEPEEGDDVEPEKTEDNK